MAKNWGWSPTKEDPSVTDARNSDLDRRYGLAAKKYGLDKSSVAAESGGDMTQQDWVGMGLYAGGALMSDSQDKKRRKEDIEREDKLMREKRKQDLQDMARRRADEQAQLFEDNFARKRGQNQTGLGMMMDQAAGAEKLGRQVSFKDALMNAGRLQVAG